MQQAPCIRKNPSEIDQEQDKLLRLLNSHGRQSAFSELYDLTVSRIYAQVRPIVNHPQDAEEVVCDTYFQVWRSASNYCEEKTTVVGWIIVIARSRALDFLRHRRRLMRTQERARLDAETQDSITAKTAMDYSECLAVQSELERVLDGTKELQRYLLILNHVYGYSHQEIAEQCAIPIGSVKSHLRRTVQRARQRAQA